MKEKGRETLFYFFILITYGVLIIKTVVFYRESISWKIL